MTVEKQPMPTPIADDDEAELGPAMRALRPKQRAFVWAMLCDPPPEGNAARWARAAGYSDKSEAAKVSAFRLLRDPKVERAILEVARTHINANGAMMAIENLLRIARDPKHKDHYQASITILDRVGLHAKSEHSVKVEHKVDNSELEKLALRLAQEMGVSPERLLGYDRATDISDWHKDAKPLTIEAKALPEPELITRNEPELKPDSFGKNIPDRFVQREKT